MNCQNMTSAARLHRLRLSHPPPAPPVISLVDTEGEEDVVLVDILSCNGEIEILNSTNSPSKKDKDDGGGNLVRRRARKRRHHKEEANMKSDLLASKVTTLPKANFHLKEILLTQLDLIKTHLDMIKQQSEDIVKKDQRLRDLQKENEKLKQRLKLIEVTTRSNSAGEFCIGGYSSTVVKDAVYKPTRRQSSEKVANIEDATLCVTPTAAALTQKQAAELDEMLVSEEESISPKATFLKCRHPFFVQQGEDFVAREKQEISMILTQAEVPGWRIHPLTSIHSMEGTENIEDVTMLKRHAKQELDEKRRKRWDGQRLRELRLIQKLRVRYEQASLIKESKRSGDFAPKSLVPDPLAAVMYVEVKETLPVSVFGGYQLPALPKTMFTLPWQQQTVSCKRRRKSLAQ